MKYEQMSKIPAPSYVEQGSVPSVGKELEIADQEVVGKGSTSEVKGQESTETKTTGSVSANADVGNVQRDVAKMGVEENSKGSSG